MTSGAGLAHDGDVRRGLVRDGDVRRGLARGRDVRRRLVRDGDVRRRAGPPAQRTPFEVAPALRPRAPPGTRACAPRSRPLAKPPPGVAGFLQHPCGKRVSLLRVLVLRLRTWAS